MKGQISIDLLFAVFFVLVVFSAYTGYTEFISKRIFSSFSYILCDYIATTTSYEEEFLSASGQSPGSDFNISFGSGPYEIRAEVDVGYSSVSVTVFKGSDVLTSCSKEVRR